MKSYTSLSNVWLANVTWLLSYNSSSSLPFFLAVCSSYAFLLFFKFRFIQKNTRCRAALDGLNDTPCAILPQIRKTPDSRFRTNRIGPGEKIHLQSVKFVTTSFYGKKLLYVAKYSLCLVTMLNCLLSQACKLPEACNAIPVQAKNLQAAYHNNTSLTPSRACD